MDGFINIYKKKGFTSADVVAVVRRIIKQKRVGHTGTLDPDAEGVLPICVGKGTKLADDIMAGTKNYIAVVTLGVTTTTEDASGDVISTCDVEFDEGKIRETVSSFIGEIEQTPPMYSAIKIQGKKLYELAREGKEVYRKPRKITIYDIAIKSLLPPNQIEIDVVCSKGTYIRTLSADIGAKLGCGGHMSSLLRTKSGNFSLDNAITLDELKLLADNNQLDLSLLSIEEILKDYKKIIISDKGTKLLHNGAKIYDYFFEKTSDSIDIFEKVTVYDSEGILMGIYEAIYDEEKNRLCVKPLKILC